MPKIYRLSRTGTRILYKVRHHKGHGIHSPFVFYFITKVIEEKSLYYAYNDIREFILSQPDITFNENKFERLLFKCVNYFNAKRILELGAGSGINTLYLTVASKQCICTSVETDLNKKEAIDRLYNKWGYNIRLSHEKFPQVDKPLDCILLNLRNYEADHTALIEYLLSLINENSFIIVDGIRTNRKHQMLWKRLIGCNEVRVSMDLFHVGILFFNPKYYKRNFKLSY